MTKSTPAPSFNPLGAFRRVPRTGVIYVTVEARAAGFDPSSPDWCNLGQGQPETTPLDGAPPRLTEIPILESDLDYAPVPGLPELREAVADLYNRRYRRGMRSQYTAENVAVCGGGRVGIMRTCAAIAPIHLGHFLPDYTAYEELLDVFRRFTPIPILLDPDEGYAFTPRQLEREILGRGLGAILMSNACNPTGKLVRGETLAEWVGLSRSLGCALILDEFYSHYVWEGDEETVSAARYVEDVDSDPVVLVDGLTKNWRYPGLRTTWVVGPKRVIEGVSSAGSFLDGGGCAPLQRAAIALLDEAKTDAETRALQRAFRPKRDALVAGLRDLGVRFDLVPEGTFYAWGDLSGLPEPLRDADDFFHAALREQVICVPGHFFDINPGQRRRGRESRFKHHARFSFGPSLATLERALERLGRVVRSVD